MRRPDPQVGAIAWELVTRAWPAMVALVAVAAVLLLGEAAAPLRLLAAVALVFVLPGQALVRALLPRRRRGLPERVGLVLAASMILTILVGLGASWTPWRISAPPVAIALAAVTVMWSIAALGRARPARPRRKRTSPSNVIPVLLVSLAVAVVGLAVWLDLQAARQALGGTQLTELWMQPDSGARGVTLGIRNRSQHIQTYDVVVREDGVSVREWTSLPIEAGRQWQHDIAVRPGAGRLSATVALPTGHEPLRVWTDVKQ